MDEPRFYRRPWVYIFFWIFILGGVYMWQLRRMGGGIRANLDLILFDGFIFFISLLVWLAFFAQFVLPVRTFLDRQKIFDRLLAHILGAHGPAVFIENGNPVKHFGEEKKKGPGVLWLDSASAAVTRTATQFKDPIGPGVHFTERGETLAAAVDLHTQMQRLGPREQEDVFAPEPPQNAEAQEKEKYEEVQKRRLEVRAWTRDGIEVVPNVTVLFKIDAPAAKGEEPGSRFGYEPETVRRAVTGEGINPGKSGEIPRRRVAWNQLPALLAVDLWREYLAKFTLGELFEATHSLPSEPTGSARPVPAETQALYQPAALAGGGGLAGILHELNVILARWADRCDSRGKDVVKVRPEVSKALVVSPPDEDLQQVTALQVINHMLKARMTQAEVSFLDDSGRPGFGALPSPEYQLLQERGLKVISASVGGLRFAPAVEEQLIRQWSATWLDNARAERERIEDQRSFMELNTGVEAFGAYAESLSRNLLKVNPRKIPQATLKTLLLRTREELVGNVRLHRRAGLEREKLEEIIQWVERNGS